MSEKEMNAYRLTSLEEPSDEMLAQLMKEVAEEAKRKGEEATEKLFKQLDETISRRKQEWALKYSQISK